ncbi:hypothetical protein E2562_008612 [Oryza meyeriana var. granulata]|uniref:Uncharacterized protein n=1 Tax=Oryza meyeriana var. granulata TaxID=110450 RepID=A0A6G1C558_9ORYZ|nr:hypothetical protein E2562_008612 [Oryza meyeriana var. granulata]
MYGGNGGVGDGWRCPNGRHVWQWPAVDGEDGPRAFYGHKDVVAEVLLGAEKHQTAATWLGAAWNGR